MRTTIVILLVCGLIDAAAQLPKGFKRIFNGRTLRGWHISRTSHQGTTPYVEVHNGELIIHQNPYGQGGVLLTNKRYGNFELYIEVKIDSFTNGGIFIRSTKSGQAYQVELANPGSTGALLGEAMKISVSTQAKDIARVWKPGEWNSFRIRMTGDVPRITLWVNDALMWEVVQPQNDFTAGATTGMIGLQCHWSALFQPVPGAFTMPGGWRAGAVHRFRNIGIKELP
jgi:hypothetical protein